jgi:hypothetical protein
MRVWIILIFVFTGTGIQPHLLHSKAYRKAISPQSRGSAQVLCSS